MSGSPFGILEYFGADKQSKSMDKATDAQYQAAMKAIDFLEKTWKAARQDFAPYLAAGGGGLTQLQYDIPAYMQNTLLPAAQQYAGYAPTPLPSANWSINPITGQLQTTGGPITQAPQTAYQPQGQTPITQAPTIQTPWTSAAASVLPSQAQKTVDTTSRMLMGPIALNAIQKLTSKVQGENVAVPEAGMPQVPLQQSTLGYQLPLTSSYNNEATTAAAPQAVTTPGQLEAGGVLAPSIPEFQRGLDLSQYAPNYQFDPNDPVYQQKLAEKNKQIDTFLAKQGLQGSSAGESFRQNEINKLLAEEDTRQYGRFMEQNVLGYTRAKTERDYLTEIDISGYNLAAARGETLYGRTYGQQSDLYNRLTQAQIAANAQNQEQLARQYGTAQDIYGLTYGGALDLAKIGTGAAGSTGQQSIITGQNVAGQYNLMGNAAAQGALGQGAIWSQYLQGLGSQMGQVGSYFGNNYLNQGGYGGGYGSGYGSGYGGGYYTGGGAGGVNGVPYYTNWEMTGIQ